MIRARLFNDETQSWNEYFKIDGYNMHPTVNYTLDESFSTASFQAYTNDIVGFAESWVKCDLDLGGEHFIGFISNYTDTTVVMGQSLRGNRLATIELVELLAVTQYMPIGSLCFTNSINSEINNENGAVTTTITTRKVQDVIERVNYQIYTTPFSEKNNVPFRLVLPDSFWWQDIVMPELFFTECTLFDVLVQIGECIGGFPYLTFINSGVYQLDYLQWDNKGRVNHTSSNIVEISTSSTTQNQGFLVDSIVHNLLQVDEKLDNTAVFPCEGGFKGAETEEYETEITKSNMLFKVNKPISKLLKVEISNPTLNMHCNMSQNTYVDITPLFVEYTYWLTLKRGRDISAWDGITYANKKTRAYYTYGKRELNNIGNIGNALKYYYIQLIGCTDMNDMSAFLVGNVDYRIRVTYIPIEKARLIATSSDVVKPIGQIYNQQSNIVSASSYGNNIQGLVNRIHGKESRVVIHFNRGDIPYKVGEYLFGEIITNATLEYTATKINGTFITSPNFNRRSQYIKLPHNFRIWEIPNGDKVSDRNLIVADDVLCSIDVPLPPSNGHLTTESLLHTLISYDSLMKKPSLAYIAFRSLNEISDINDPKDSRNFALATLNSIPVGRGIHMHWETQDNASMGERTYFLYINEIGNNRGKQMYVPYNQRAVYLNCKLSRELPISYEYDNQYTEEDDEQNNFENNVDNKNFATTFPMSNKRQWEECNYIANFSDLFIQKDLSERILFNYQLNFIGKNDTIVYENACSLNKLCNSKSTTSFKIWVSDTPFSYWDKKGKGTPYNAVILSKTIENGCGVSEFGFNYQGKYDHLAITDNNNNLLFATNREGIGGVVRVYMSNRKKEWVKI